MSSLLYYILNGANGLFLWKVLDDDTSKKKYRKKFKVWAIIYHLIAILQKRFQTLPMAKSFLWLTLLYGYSILQFVFWFDEDNKKRYKIDFTDIVIYFWMASLAFPAFNYYVTYYDIKSLTPK